MTDLDLPSLELGRYVDLIKRRRWQLVPIGFLGLLIGFIVAWSIPRFYVANTKVQLYPPLIGGEVGGFTREDPFLREVNKARITILRYELVKQAIEKLGWEDYFAAKGSPEEFAYVYDVIGRIAVLDLDPSQNRSSATLEISFRDQDPVRAAEFANTLRDIYLESERRSIVSSGRLQLGMLQDQEEKARQALEERADELKLFQQQTGYMPELSSDPTGRGEQRSRQEEGRRRAQSVADLKQEIANLQAQLRLQRERLSAMQPRRPKAQPESDPLVINRLKVVERINENQRILALWVPGHEEYKRVKALLQEDEELLAEIDKLIAAKGLDTEANPAYVALQAQITDGSTKLAGIQEELRIAEASLEEIQEQIAELPEIQSRHRRLVQKYDSAKEALDAAERSVLRQQNEVVSLETGAGAIIRTIAPATPPLAPTYPNRLLLTLIGLGIGIAFALATIVLLDFLQPTWKSLDEVARGLRGLPALGGVAHLDLPEDIAAARRKRVRIAMAASIVFVLLGSIVAVYYWEPLRLPEAVRVVLDGILRSKG
jgi:succinoglycan biosynthesis transport protein ExoP